MTDEQFNLILSEVPEIQHLIVKSGRMATKTIVENILMTRHNIDRNQAHGITNTAECRNLNWRRANPDPNKYPEIS